MKKAVKKVKTTLCGYILNRLEKINLSGKLLVMQIFCVILPIFITDAVIIGIAVSGERQLVLKDMENTASVVKYLITDHVNSAALFARNVYSNQYVNGFISQNFPLNWITITFIWNLYGILYILSVCIWGLTAL